MNYLCENANPLILQKHMRAGFLHLFPRGQLTLCCHFLELKFPYFDWNYTEDSSQGSNWLSTSIVSDNGLAPNRWQAIIWINDGLVYWCIHVSLSLNVISQWKLTVPNSFWIHTPLYERLSSQCGIWTFEKVWTYIIFGVDQSYNHGTSLYNLWENRTSREELTMKIFKLLRNLQRNIWKNEISRNMCLGSCERISYTTTALGTKLWVPKGLGNLYLMVKTGRESTIQFEWCKTEFYTQTLHKPKHIVEGPPHICFNYTYFLMRMNELFFRTRCY